MSPLRYKTLLTFLPGMAVVVNSFQSPQVQAAVYETLMEALEARLLTEGAGRTTAPESPASLARPANSGELTHDLIEGESIHSLNARGDTRATATVL